MALCFLHTADLQLGKPFASLTDDGKRHRLQQERLEAIQRMAKLVEETQAAFVLVAGDLFDTPRVTKPTVSAACAAFGALRVPVYVIPGNHDHGGTGSIWQQEFFIREQQQLAPNLKVLLTPEPLVLPKAVLFPAPLLRRHESSDPTAWIRSAVLDPSLPTDRPKIVLAHGTVQGFGSTQEDEEGGTAAVNFIDLSKLPMEAIDYVALGDWHGTKQVAPNAWYSGTPEIDRFPKGEGNDPGNLLQVTLNLGEAPVVNKLPWGRFIWKELHFWFSDDESLGLFAQQVDELLGQRSDEHLLLLSLAGSLGIAAADRLEKMLESWESRLIRLKVEDRVTIAPSNDEIAALTSQTSNPLIRAVATELVAAIAGDSEDAAIARIALRELHAALC